MYYVKLDLIPFAAKKYQKFFEHFRSSTKYIYMVFPDGECARRLGGLGTKWNVTKTIIL